VVGTGDKCHEETSHRPRLEVCGANKLEVTPLFDHLVGAGGEHGGTSMPSAQAVFRLMTNSNLVVCTARRSVVLPRMPWLMLLPSDHSRRATSTARSIQSWLLRLKTKLLASLRKQGIVTKVRTLNSGATVGGIPFTRGPLAHLLRNRFYIGEVMFKGEVLAGEQPAIVDRDLFGAVQAKLSETAE
jgi:Recombinase